jgi:hypothetical protein
VVKACKGLGESSLETALLGWREVLGEREGGEFLEGSVDPIEATLRLDRAVRERRGTRLGAQSSERLAQERTAVGLIGDNEELHECEDFWLGQAVALGAIEQLVLVLVRQLAQATRDARADGPLGHLALGSARQTGGQGQTPLDPAGFAAQQAGDARGGELVLLDERADHLALVEGGDGARRGVGLEQKPFVLGPRSRALQDDGDECLPLLTPTAQALESVDDLETAPLDRDDPQRHIGQRLADHWAHLLSSQLLEASREPIDRHSVDQAGIDLAERGQLHWLGEDLTRSGSWPGHENPVSASHPVRSRA